MKGNMLKIKNLSAGIEGNKILNNINLDINSGELHVIMGTNGTGKSTLGNILSGKENYQIHSGDIIYLSNNYFHIFYGNVVIIFIFQLCCKGYSYRMSIILVHSTDTTVHEIYPP